MIHSEVADLATPGCFLRQGNVFVVERLARGWQLSWETLMRPGR